MKRHLFLLGSVGVGKTHLILDLLKAIDDEAFLKKSVCGFYTRSVRKGDEQKCFGHNITTFRTERTGQLSRLKDGTKGLPLLNSRFVINVPMFDGIVMEELQPRPETRLVILDELGIAISASLQLIYVLSLGEMQLCSKNFANLIPVLLDRESFVVGAIPSHEAVKRHEVIQHVLKRSDIQFKELTQKNRNLMKWIVRKQFAQRIETEADL